MHHPQDRAERMRIKKLKSEKAKGKGSHLRHAFKEAIKLAESEQAIEEWRKDQETKDELGTVEGGAINVSSDLRN